MVGADGLVAVGDGRLLARGTASRSWSAAAGTSRASPRRPAPRGARRRPRRRSPRPPRRRSAIAIQPWLRHAWPAISAVGKVCSRSSTSACTARATSSPIAMQPAGEFGPCSAWPSRSVATSRGSAEPSAITSTSVGSGQQIDPDAAEQLALGLGHKRVAGADQHVNRLEAVDQPERHRRQRLHPAEAQHSVGARGAHRVEHRRMDALLTLRRGAGDNLLDAGDLGDEHRHERRRQHRITPAGDVGADGVDRDQAVAEHDAVADLDLQLADGPALGGRERADLVLGEGDVLLDRDRRAARPRRSNSASETTKSAGRPAVELQRVAAHRVQPAALDVLEDLARRGPEAPRWPRSSAGSAPSGIWCSYVFPWYTRGHCVTTGAS